MTEFNIGTAVRLRYAPTGEPGTVTGTCRGKCEVRWPDLGVSTKHSPESLVMTEIVPSLQEHE
jgi:hypothetical protein